MTLRDRAASLTAFVEDRAGDLFLGTVTYTASGHDLVSVADHVREAYDDETVGTLVNLLRDHHAVSTDVQYPTIPAGELQTAVYVLESAIVLHYKLGDTDGVAVALDQAPDRTSSSSSTNPDSTSKNSLSFGFPHRLAPSRTVPNRHEMRFRVSLVRSFPRCLHGRCNFSDRHRYC